MELTKDNTGVNLNLALNYGSRDDIKNAIIDIINDAKCGKINIEEINENTIRNHLDTKSIPDPDLVIRTSGEQRLSNFLIWEVAYAEFYFTDIHWPDFNEKELQKAIYVYQNRDRRFGGLSNSKEKIYSYKSNSRITISSIIYIIIIGGIPLYIG